MPDYLTVAWVNPNSLSTAQWSEKKEKIAKALAQAKAFDEANALTGKEVLKLIGDKTSNYPNLRKTLTSTAGIVTLIPTAYKSTVANRFYIDQRIIEAAVAINPARFYPEKFTSDFINKVKAEKWPSARLQVPHGMTHEEARRAYQASYGVVITPPGSVSIGASIQKAPTPKWFENWFDKVKANFESQNVRSTNATLPLWLAPDEYYMNDEQIREHLTKQLTNKNTSLSQVLFEFFGLLDLNYRTAKKLEKK